MSLYTLSHSQHCLIFLFAFWTFPVIIARFYLLLVCFVCRPCFNLEQSSPGRVPSHTVSFLVVLCSTKRVQIGPTLPDWCVCIIAEFKECFSLYDRQRKGKIDAQDLITVMRCLGSSPTPSEVQRHLLIHSIGMPVSPSFFLSMVASVSIIGSQCMQRRIRKK